LTFRLLPKAKTVSVPKGKQVTARTLGAPKKIRIAYISAFSSLKDRAGYTEIRYARASPIVLGKIHWHKLPRLINGRSEICVLSEEITRELNLWLKSADWKMITANGNWSDLPKVAETMLVNIHRIIVSVPIFLAKSRSKLVVGDLHSRMVMKQWSMGEEAQVKKTRIIGRESMTFAWVSKNHIAPKLSQIQLFSLYLGLAKCNLRENTKPAWVHSCYKCVVQKVKPVPL